MEYITVKDQKVKKITNDDKTVIANKIVSDYKTYDNARTSQLEQAVKLKKEIFFKNMVGTSKDKEKAWKSTMKLCKIFMYYQVLKAFIWKNVYSNTNSMFDVSGESFEADDNSNKQKTALVDILEKMKYSNTCDKIIDYSLTYGELISFVTWKKHSEEYRRPISFFDAVSDPVKIPKILEAKSKGQNFFIDERIDYDNPYISAVNPANFVYDTTQDENFETAPKIYRTWRTPYDIINNKYFEITKECKEYLLNLVKDEPNSSNLGNQDNENLSDKHDNGSTIEVLEHWGDLTLKDGTTLKNWYAVCVAGKFLVAFEKNPFVINPFTYGCYIKDPDTKRGISPLYSVYDISNTQEDYLRRTMNLQALTENPPILAGKGFFGDDPDDVELYPGKILEYDANMYQQVPVQPMEFNATVFSNDMEYIDGIMSEISGIFPNMAGQTENDRTTATEISTKVEGQLTRLKMIIDVINNYLILPDVEKVAKLKSNFTFGNETVFINNENQPEDVTITDEIRQGEYRYTYADRSATSERLNYADMIAQSIQMFLKAGLPANVEEVFLWYMEQKGVENPERFIINQNMIDPQVQQVLMQNPQLAPIIQEMQNRVQMAKQGQDLPDDIDTPTQQETPQNDQSEAMQNPSASLPGRNLLNE